ncbi:alpha/beta fold hydrolase [Marinomonas spartinae]|uniref:alpha/beta fold hydrolase n=1 Tax=Marinomonas spartinae TaxID=1792290 RepID=UPI0018F217E2|nr:alpha/beta hydrolase [Marinomonas spartinae]MBJ7553704.1 alpha/beta hydrolase [Marinomonas spartinae]
MSDVFFLSLKNGRIAYRLHENPEADADRACLMLHGAGVDGDITYSPMLPFLKKWRWILMPDLKGMGASYHHGGKEAPVTIAELTGEVEALLLSLDWREFDVVGYSLGGLVALNLNHHRVMAGLTPLKMALLEPASLDREDLQALIEVRKKYRQASQTIRETGDVELGVASFMDTVSPNRRKNPAAESTTQSRLAHRPLGFAFALDAVTNHVEVIAAAPEYRQAMIEAAKEVFLLSGELSNAALKEHYQLLSERYEGWHHKVFSGCDHSLPFQKPRQIAKLVDKWFFPA